MALDGFHIVCLEPGADNPKEHAPVPAPDPPEGFVDNTVYRYRMVDGEKVLIGTMPAFPEGWDKASEFNKSIKEGKEEGEEQMASRIDNWPEIITRGLELLESQSMYKTSAQLVEEFKLSITPNAVWAKLKKAAEEKAKELNEPLQKAGTINQDSEEDKPDPNIWQKVCRHCGAMLGNEKYFYKGWLCPVCFKSEIQAFTLGPDEEIMPISAPYGVEIPKQDELPLIQEVKKPGVDLGPIKIQLVATLLAEYRDCAIDDQVALGLTRGILDLQLPEVI